MGTLHLQAIFPPHAAVDKHNRFGIAQKHAALPLSHVSAGPAVFI